MFLPFGAEEWLLDPANGSRTRNSFTDYFCVSTLPYRGTDERLMYKPYAGGHPKPSRNAELKVFLFCHSFTLIMAEQVPRRSAA
tara:strand:- start:305 stop:556 length:252 start_codon:yes stop_codon:yes gene_type:complete